MRLIDADALTRIILSEGSYQNMVGVLEEEIDNAPTIDAEPVVRCKDCKHKYVTGDTTQYYVCDFMDAQYEDNGYCHHGERREP